MTIPKNAKGKPFSWSPSAVSDYISCPAQYGAKRFYDILPFVETPQMKAGNVEHKHLELRLKHKTKLPEGYERGEKYCRAIEAAGGETHAERELAINRDMKFVSWFAKDAYGRVKIDVTSYFPNKAFVGDWKGLALNTKIPTPDGWKTVEQVEPGDDIFAGDGSICCVTGKSPVFFRDCYEITFRDGATVICDDQHLWEVAKNGSLRLGSEVISAKMLEERMVAGEGFSMRTAGVAQYEEVILPVHPYVLGCWLGDGKHTSGEITKPNADMFDAIRECGYTVGENSSKGSKCEARTVQGLVTQLRTLGVLGNKHIPKQYLTASFHQRLALLQGLMDTDGTWNFSRRQAVFTTISRGLAYELVELLSSLGQKAYCVELNKHGVGKHIKAFDIIFTPNGLVPFCAYHRLKEIDFSEVAQGRCGRRYVSKIAQIPSVPTQCLAVDSEDHTYLCTERYLVTHNTGNVKEDSLQLKINACFLSLENRGMQEYITRYIWLKHDVTTGETFKDFQIPALWAEVFEWVHRMEKAWQEERFEPRKNGLCRNWCAHTACKFCGK